MNYTIPAGGSSAGARVWASIWAVLADGGERGPGAVSASFPASGGGGEGGASGEERLGA